MAVTLKGNAMMKFFHNKGIYISMSLCKNAGICGGCYYQGTEYSEELQKKEQGVRDLLDPVIRTPYLFEEIIPSPKELYYRNKMEFTFGDSEKDGPLTLGLHQKHSFFNIINAEDCQITDPDVGAIVKRPGNILPGGRSHTTIKNHTPVICAIF